MRGFVLTCSILKFIQFPIVYILFKMGYSPLLLSWASLIVYIIIALWLEPYLLVKVVGYTYQEVYKVIKNCLSVTICSLPFPLFIYFSTDVNTIQGFVCVCTITLINILLVVFYIGLDINMRQKVLIIVGEKLFRKW